MEENIRLNIPINPRAFYRSVCDFTILARGEASAKDGKTQLKLRKIERTFNHEDNEKKEKRCPLTTT